MNTDYNLVALMAVWVHEIGAHIPNGTLFRAGKINNTQYWSIYLPKRKRLTVTNRALYKLLMARKINTTNSEQLEHFVNELKATAFMLLPNQDLFQVFEHTYTQEEDKEYRIALWEKYATQKERATRGGSAEHFDFKSVPIIEQPMYVSWPADIWECTENMQMFGNFQNIYSVRLSQNTLEVIEPLLEDHSFYIEVLEQDDRFKFFLRYSSIIGNRWLFENFKHKIWGTLKKERLSVMPIGSIFVSSTLRSLAIRIGWDYAEGVGTPYASTIQDTNDPDTPKRTTYLLKCKSKPSRYFTANSSKSSMAEVLEIETGARILLPGDAVIETYTPTKTELAQAAIFT